MSCVNWIGRKNKKHDLTLTTKKQAESKTKVSVAVNYVSINTKELKNIEKFTFIFIGVGPYFDVRYACFFPIHNSYHEHFC